MPLDQHIPQWMKESTEYSRLLSLYLCEPYRGPWLGCMAHLDIEIMQKPKRAWIWISSYTLCLGACFDAQASIISDKSANLPPCWDPCLAVAVKHSLNFSFLSGIKKAWNIHLWSSVKCGDPFDRFLVHTYIKEDRTVWVFEGCSEVRRLSLSSFNLILSTWKHKCKWILQI